MVLVKTMKMSKSRGNVTAPDDLVARWSRHRRADVFARWDMRYPGQHSGAGALGETTPGRCQEPARAGKPDPQSKYCVVKSIDPKVTAISKLLNLIPSFPA
jgi:hypothetical protein